MKRNRLAFLVLVTAVAAGDMTLVKAEETPVAPLVRTVDLNVGESADVELCDGSTVSVKVLDLKERRDAMRNAVREARVKVEVDGTPVTLVAAMYHLPKTVSGTDGTKVRIDCPVTRGYTDNSSKKNVWGLEKDVRLRLWPGGSPLLRPGTFCLPVRMRWFASDTQMANDPCYVDGGETPGQTSIYYHYGLDFGGAEGMSQVVAATDGLVVSAADKTLPEYRDSPAKPRYDVIYLVDGRGWFYRYSHLVRIDVEPGQRVKMGQQLGLLGKEGGSGGWSHLHFDVTSRQPSGQWGIQDAYAYAWEANQRQNSPEIIAVARPHQFVAVGQKVTLDGSKSWSKSGKITRYEWTLTDGNTKLGAKVAQTYDRPGMYRETLKITDAAGNGAWDFASVQVVNPEEPKKLPPSIHAVYHPTTGIRPGDDVTFKVRSFRTTHGEEVWDFGDGSPTVTTKSDGNAVVHAEEGYAVTTHRYTKPGRYLVRVQRTNERGEKATARLQVDVEDVPFKCDFDSDRWFEQWGLTRQPPRVALVDSDPTRKFEPHRDRALRIRVDEGGHYGLSLQYGFKEQLGYEPEEVYFRYYLRLADDWAPARGGKLPGFGGTYGRAGWGGRPVDGTDGWSARGQFGGVKNSRTPIGFYCYHMDMRGQYGSGWMWNQESRGLLENNRWYCIEQYVKLNTPGMADGILRGWVDGQPAFEKTDIRFRETDKLKVENIWINIYLGGKWTSLRDQHLYIDDVTISTRPIGVLKK